MAGLMDRRRALALGLGGGAALALPGWAFAQDGDAWLDTLVQSFMTRFDVPGLAVAIVRKDQPPLVRGYGVRTLGRPARVDEHTRFGIASNSKAFTAALLAQLVDEGKVAWDEPVVRYMPEFRMADPAVTQMMTVRDLLVHRSGLPLGAGDLLYFPASTHDARAALAALPHLKAERGFRSGYAYDNILYIVAGELIARLTGKPWGEVVTTRILTPLGMADAVPSRFALRTDNVAGRHARLGPPVRGMGAMTVIKPDEPAMIDAAGGINASVSDLAKWFQVQLAGGALPGGGRLWSEAQAREMWTPQVIISSSDGPTPQNPARSVQSSYALGWQVQDYRSHRMIAHSGGLSGQITQTAMIPSRGIGVAVLTNVEDGTSGPLRNAILDQLLGAPAFDWAAMFAERTARANAEATKALGSGTTAPAGGPSLPLSAYAGRYRDPWYGDIVVTEKAGRLGIDFVPTPVFKGPLEPWGKDAFRTRFAKDAGEDAVVTFAVADGKVTGVTMKALSPLADFSYDFHHLAFVPVR